MAGAAAAVAATAPAAGASSWKVVGGTMVTIVKFEVVSAGRQPSGSFRSRTCTASWKSNPATSIVIGFGDGVGGDDQFERMRDEVDRAAALQARRGLAVRYVDGNADPDSRAGAQAQEVDMHRLVGDDVELIVSREHALLAAVDVEFENGRQEVPCVDELVDFLELERNRLGFLSAAVNYGGYAALATNGAGGPLACPATRHGREFFDRCHVGFPLR